MNLIWNDLYAPAKIYGGFFFLHREMGCGMKQEAHLDVIAIQIIILVTNMT